MGQQPVYTDLSVRGALRLEIAGVEYEVTQYASSWASNEIPSAVCMLALGRNVRTLKKAKIHEKGVFRQMLRARVHFFPFGDFSPLSPWPLGSRVIFDGFFTGFAYRKVEGKVHVVANLIHWLAALGCSSTLTKLGHVSNPTAMNAAAVLGSTDLAGAGLGSYISSLAVTALVGDNVGADLWGAMKTVFCSLASIATMPPGREGECGGGGDPQVNDFALQALGRIEGPGGDCARPYLWGTALKLDTLGIAHAADALGESLGLETVEAWAATSFWDKLVAQYCPAFGMAVVPMVDTAVVIADVPALRNKQPYRTIRSNEYDSYDMAAELHRPLRAVGVVASYESPTQAGLRGPADALPIVGGCHVEDSVAAGDGTTLVVAAPPWLRSLQFQPAYAADSTGVGGERPSPTATTPGEPLARGTFGVDTTELYKRYAHSVFVNHMLRGRVGSLSGKLRFDIAPSSIVRITSTVDKFIGGEDDLAMTVIANVTRVTIAINSEAGLAGTTLSLSHIRTEEENAVPRTSVDRHPLFGDSIHAGGQHGSPLVDDYNLP
jgi:hypothetical protein